MNHNMNNPSEFVSSWPPYKIFIVEDFVWKKKFWKVRKFNWSMQKKFCFIRDFLYTFIQCLDFLAIWCSFLWKWWDMNLKEIFQSFVVWLKNVKPLQSQIQLMYSCGRIFILSIFVDTKLGKANKTCSSSKICAAIHKWNFCSCASFGLSNQHHYCQSNFIPNFRMS